MRKHLVINAVVLAACVGDVLAANTRFIMEVSADGGETWGPSVNVFTGSVIHARLRAEFVGSEAVLGLARFDAKFRVNEYDTSTDAIGAWGTPAFYMAGAGGVATGENGRPSPFAGFAARTLPTVTIYSARVEIGGSQFGRIPVTQGPASQIGTHFNTSVSPVVFTFSCFVALGLGNVSRSLSVELSDVFNQATNNVTWYTDSDGSVINAPQLVSDAPLRTASVIVTPAPGALGLVAVFGAAALRRRRVSRGACIGRECRHISLALSHSFSGDQL